MKKHKESLQLKRIASIFAGSDVTVYGPFQKVVFRGENTDLDAILFSPNQKVAWCCQIKSPAPARWRKDYARIASDIDEAYVQVDKSLGWLASEPQSVLQSLRISEAKFRSLDFRGVVISSKAFGGDLAKSRTDIPLTTEYLLSLLVKAQGKVDLDLLWMNIKSAAVLPIEGIDYFLIPAICDLGSLRCSVPVGSFKLIRCAKPH
jgi:hypothetical protein